MGGCHWLLHVVKTVEEYPVESATPADPTLKEDGKTTLEEAPSALKTALYSEEIKSYAAKLRLYVTSKQAMFATIWLMCTQAT